MILDCSSYDSTKLSLASIFNTTEDELTALLRSLRPFDNYSEPPERVLYADVCSTFGEPRDDIKVLWFHGSRVEDGNLFYEDGILTKSEARKFIEPRLIEMAEGLERSGSNPFSTSISGKQGPHDEGPFAFLIRDVVIQAPSPNHNYLEAPEMVEDIAGTLLGSNYMQLVELFKEVTNPCVVSFLSESKGHELPSALLYLKLVEDGDDDLEAASSANTFFDSEGVVISPDRIQTIEIL